MNQSFWLNKKVLCFPISSVTWIISQETDKNRLNLLIQIFFNFSCLSGSLLLYKLLMKKNEWQQNQKKILMERSETSGESVSWFGTLKTWVCCQAGRHISPFLNRFRFKAFSDGPVTALKDGSCRYRWQLHFVCHKPSM